MPDDHKTCSTCKEQKPREQFGKNRAQRDGLHNQCKPCQAESRRRYREKGGEAVKQKQREYERRYRERNLEARREATRRWQAENKVAYAEGIRRRRAENPEVFAARWKKYYGANRDELLRKHREWAAANPDKVKASRDPERMREDSLKRRARKRNAYVAPVRFTDILLRDNGICGICEKPIMQDAIDIDHISPLAAGGKHMPENVQLAHPTCNRRKHARVNFTLRDTA